MEKGEVLRHLLEEEGIEKEKERGERDRKDGKRARWQRGLTVVLFTL